jgi:predicted permease
VGLLLLMSCATVAGLLLARGAERRGELAVRMSLGAGRGRVVRQLLTESLVLGAVGGLVGLVLAWSGTALVSSSAGDLLPRSAEVGLDPGVLLFAIAVTLLTTTIFGLLPARRMAGRGLEAVLRESGASRTLRGPAGMRLRRGLVAGEIAVAVVLSVAAILLARSLTALERVDLGFEPERAAAMTLTLALEKYPTRPEYMALYRTLLERTGELPGVEAVGSLRRLPTRGGGETQDFSVPGLYEPGAEDEPNVEVIHVGGRIFDALGTPVLAGRVFDERDGPEAPVRLVVNQAFVRAYLGDAEPLGRPVAFGEVPAEIIGVVADIRHGAPEAAADPAVYVHQEQNSRIAMTFIVRVGEGVEPESVLASLRGIVNALDADQPITELLPLEVALAEALALPRTVARILTGFAALAVLLAALGVYGVMATMVRARVRELGLRMALGAGAGNVVALVVREGVVATVAGLAVGLAGAALLARVMESLLYGVPPLDPVSFVVAASGLAALCLAASALPAVRASRLQPMDVLRSE